MKRVNLDMADDNRLSLTLRESFGSDASSHRRVNLGVEPVILIELFGGGAVTDLDINIDATGPSDRRELATFLEGVVEWLRDAPELPA